MLRFRNVPITWSQSPRSAALACAGADWQRVQPRGPPPPLDDDRPRLKPYIWKRGNEEIVNKRISSNGTLEVRKAGGGNEGIYQCGVRHHGGLVMGYPVNLKFSYMDKQFLAQPEDVTAKAGQPLVIPCRIGSGPPPVVTWYRGSELLHESDRYHILSSGLLILEVKREDEGAYRCIASNSYANRSRSSHEGQITVVESTWQKPEFLSVDLERNISAARGSKVVLVCPVLGWPKPKLIWKLKPPVGRTSELESTDEVLVLPKLEYDQEGVYTCTIEGRSDLVKNFNVSLTEAVRITLPPLSKEAMRASTVRFNCTASGKPSPHVSWYKDGRLLPLRGRINVLLSADHIRQELVIGGLISEDAGVYQCFGWNGASVASAWAVLNVTGPDTAAPRGVACAPAAAAAVAVRWAPAAASVTAYVVSTTPRDKEGKTITGQPHTNTEETIKVMEPLTPYIFQVRVILPSSTINKNIASDMSESVVCQGQGVPIKLLKLENDKVMVSWQEFAKQTPGVVEWILQYRPENQTDVTETNITLAAPITNYTLAVSAEKPLAVRVLGSRSRQWLPQNLTLVPWDSTAHAGNDDGWRRAVVSGVWGAGGARAVSLRWRCGGGCGARATYRVCLRARAALHTDCQDTSKTSITVDDLQPDTEYEVRVQVLMMGHSGPFTDPYYITTQSEGPSRFKNLTSKFLNSSTLRVTWDGEPAKYTVHYSDQLKLPVEQWNALETVGNTVVITGIDPTQQTFVMVTGYDPLGHSSILTVPSQPKESEEVRLVQFWRVGAGVRVRWAGAATAAATVRYSQNLTAPIETWRTITVAEPQLELYDVDMSLPLYVSVAGQMLTIPPLPSDSNFYLGLGLGLGICALLMLAVIAVCLWRRKKRAQSPARARRAGAAAELEGAEMKRLSGRLCNGAGEPLLNGHVHITENPASKTPNGRVKKGRRQEIQFEPFDLSRQDPDTTQETVLADISFSLLDTSRRPEYEARSLRDSANNSFSKLPDDNMNSELTRSSELDSSTIQPTLQPNG